MKIIGIIPARYGSTRFPGKPLVDIKGKTMIQHVYEKVLHTGLFHAVVVATDDTRILKEVQSFNGNVLMTSENHQSGTDRCAEVLEKLEETFDVVINIQGDEPFIEEEQLSKVIELFKDETTQIGTVVKRIDDTQDVDNPNRVKVVFNKKGAALYFSRSAIPYNKNNTKINYYKHIGLYGYRYMVLKEIATLPPSPLELQESLEQLRWLENGYSIKVAETNKEAKAIDTEEDLKNLLKNLI